MSHRLRQALVILAYLLAGLAVLAILSGSIAGVAGLLVLAAIAYRLGAECWPLIHRVM